MCRLPWRGADLDRRRDRGPASAGGGVADQGSGRCQTDRARLQAQELRGGDCFHKQDRRDRGRGRPSPVDHHRVGQGDRAVVVA